MVDRGEDVQVMKDPDYLPTPEQIREECRKIRETWTPRDWERRDCRKPRPLETKVVPTPQVPT